MNGAPAPVAVADTSATAVLSLEILSVTPPWFAPPRRAVYERCRLLPTVVFPLNTFRLMPGPVTETVTALIGSPTAKPSAAAVTVVEPAPTGSSATPPAATDVAENALFGRIVTVRLAAVPASVVSVPTAPLLLVSVTVSAPPGRTFWISARLVPTAFGIPTPTWNASSIARDVVEV